MSYRSRHLQSPKYAEKMRQKRQTLLFLGALCFVTITASGILLLRVPFVQIKTVVVEGATVSSLALIEAATLSSLEGNYFQTIPFSSTFFFPKNKIDEALQDQFKEIEDLQIRRKGFSGLKLSIKERAPAAVVCSGFRDTETLEECYWSDNRGYIFGAVGTSSAPTTLSLAHYYVPSEAQIKPGVNFLQEQRFSELQKFMNGALRGGLVPLGLLIGENGEYEMYIKNKDGDSEVTVYFDDRASFENTLENLLTFWHNATNPSKNTTPPVFDYINLRFGNTVYYSAQ